MPFGIVACTFSDNLSRNSCIRLKIYWLPKFDMLFQLLRTNFCKSELFSCLQKVNQLLPKKKVGEWKVWVEVYLRGLETLSFATMFNPSSPSCWFSHDVTKIQAKRLSILPRFYFHDALEQLKTNFHTNFRFKRVLGFVIEDA